MAILLDLHMSVNNIATTVGVWSVCVCVCVCVCVRACLCEKFINNQSNQSVRHLQGMDGGVYDSVKYQRRKPQNEEYFSVRLNLVLLFC